MTTPDDQSARVDRLSTSDERSRDLAIMEKVRSDDDASAFDTLLDLYWSPLVGYAMRILGSPDAAEDVVQAAFIRVWERRSEWRPSGSVRAFFYRIVRNLALNEQRSRKVRARWAARRREVGRDGGPTPVESMEKKELRAAVEQAIQRLPDRRREVFELSRFHNLSYRQIAEIMDIAPQTVANQLSAALATLRGELAPYLSE